MLWSKVLEVGHVEIDAQHQELVKHLNVFLDAMAQGKSKEETAKFLNFLAEYIVSHFAAEEKIMAKFAYPQMRAHRALHMNFIKDLQSMEEEFHKNGPSENLSKQLQKRVVDWFVKHISHVDTELSAFLKTKSD
ncbi:MAG: bacteriohemerythrin [Candidatus Ozemobacteraceae bacterium]